MRSQPETTHHELYIRMVNPQKPAQAAPLKLTANVVGKFMVERELGGRVERAVRDRTQQAEKQKQERKIELLDVPLPHVASTKPAQSKKSKQNAKPQKSTPAGFAQPDPHRSLSGTSSLQPSRVASPRPSPRPANSTPSARSRLVHCVALQFRTSDEILNMVAGSDSVARKEVSTLIPEVRLTCLDVSQFTDFTWYTATRPSDSTQRQQIRYRQVAFEDGVLARGTPVRLAVTERPGTEQHCAASTERIPRNEDTRERPTLGLHPEPRHGLPGAAASPRSRLACASPQKAAHAAGEKVEGIGDGHDNETENCGHDTDEGRECAPATATEAGACQEGA
jgi:hypothetical protein